MEPIFGFALYALCCFVVALIAKARGRSATIFFLVQLALGFAATLLAFKAGAAPMEGALAGFVIPGLGLIAALGMKSAEAITAEKGSFRGLKKCPHCAESIKEEAAKCKHCGSAVI